MPFPGSREDPVLEGEGVGFRVQGSGCRVQGSGFRVQGSGFRVQGAGFRVQGSGFRVWGFGSTCGRCGMGVSGGWLKSTSGTCFGV